MTTERETGAPHFANGAKNETLARQIHDDCYAVLRECEYNLDHLADSRESLEALAATASNLRRMFESPVDTAAARPEDKPEDADELQFEPPARTFVTYDGIDITEVRGSTRWHVSKESPRTMDDMRFTAREDSDFHWWRVTPADTDYWHVHQLHGRSLAFEFLDLVNLPDGDDDRVSGTALGCIAKGMAEAGRRDWRQETIAGGFWNAIGEYLIDGTCDR